jgi:hypothetical protein
MAGEYYELELGDEPKVVRYPDKIETGGIATCIAVGILNHVTKQGYLGHYYFLERSSESLIDRAISEAQNIADLEVALAGNVPFIWEDGLEFDANFEKEVFDNVIKDLESHRAHGRWALQMVKSKGIRRIQNHLLENPRKDSYEMLVDTEERRIKVRKERI